MTATDDAKSEPARPVLIFDGDCSFCRRWVGRWRTLTGDAIEFVPSQEAAARFPQISREAFGQSVWLVEPDGKISGAALAVFRSLALARQKRYLLWGYEHVPGVAGITEFLYQRVANNRDTLDRVDRYFIPDPNDPRRSYKLTQNLFLRCLGLVYLAAFLSLFVQVDGLIGSRGILPAADFLAAAQSPGVSVIRRFFELPTLCWLNPGDGFLHFLCGGGIGLSFVLVLGVLPAPTLLLLWLFYLSLTNVGQIFLGYQWDALLLEAGFLAILLAPLQWRLGPSSAAPSCIAIFLLRWLLFRLVFLSGLVKLASGDAAWRGLRALRYHYETQPLPTWTSWYAHQAPPWFQAASTIAVLAIELGAPLFFFARRGKRMIACAATVFLQVLIALTGNYGFFNLLAIVLCLTLFDDSALRRFARAIPFFQLAGKNRLSGKMATPRWPWWITAPLACALVPLSLAPALSQIGRPDLVPGWLAGAWESVAQFDSINGYGLFAVMTTSRPELIIEGSNDGEHWLAYEFKWKPGDVDRAPGFCLLHMPRLDWQMWFAALSPSAHREMLLGLLDRLHEGSPPVIGLLRHDPFERPPRYLRIVKYEYRFTTFSERTRDGAWWRRERVGQLSIP